MANERKDIQQDVFDNLAGKTNAEIDTAYQLMLREEKELELEIKRETVAKIRGQRQQRLEEAHQRTLSAEAFIRNREANQRACNHRKGGRDAEAIIRGRGTASEYCVVKHLLPQGGFFIICQRCGKEWLPANEYAVVDGRVARTPATPGYDEALNYPTDNTSSTSAMFQFSRTESR